MELSEIITDALHYPIQNIQTFAIYIVLGIITALVLILTGVTALITATGDGDVNMLVLIIGLIITAFIYFMIEGYVLDIIKHGINRRNTAPSVDPVRQISNGIKLMITEIVYYILPIIISILLGITFIPWFSGVINLVLTILFGLLLAMSKCRLAQTDNLGYALAIEDAYNDLTRIGIEKVLLTVVITIILSFIIVFILGFIGNLISADIGVLLGSIGGIYTLFFSNRAIGLLYSEN